MRLAVTIARPHDGEKFEVLTGPEVPIGEQLADLKELQRVTTNADFAEVQLWESGKGKSKHVRFGKPKETPVEPKK